MNIIKKLLTSIMIAGTLLSVPTAFAENTPPKMEAKTEAAVKPKTTAAVVEQVNINTASAAEIQKALIGIGAKKAEAIVQYREKHGAFTAAEQLMEVQGIGKATFEKNKDRIALTNKTTSHLIFEVRNDYSAA